MTDLRLVSDIYPGHPLYADLHAWAQSVSELSGGAHSVTVFDPGELVSPYESFDAVATGTVDMAFLNPLHYPSQLPGAAALALPFQASAGANGSAKLYEALTSPSVAADFGVYGMSVLAAAYDAPQVLYTSDAVSGPDGLEGLKLVGAGPFADPSGFVAVRMPWAEVYAALQTGVIDGVFASPAQSGHFHEVTGGQLALPGDTGFMTHYATMVINSDTAAGLPADLRALLASSTGSDLSASLGATSLTAYRQNLDDLAAVGNLTTASGADLAAWRELTLVVQEELIVQSTVDGSSQAREWLDALAAAGDATTPAGTAGDDVLEGGEGADLLEGLDGADRLLGMGGNDTLEGGDGPDTINGGDGDDLIRGGATEADRRDVIYGGAGNDSIDGGYGNDLIYGQGGNDTIAGGFGADELQGQDGNDVITGSAFGDIVFGNAGDDFVNGGFGHDLINGGSGADKFFHVGGSREQMLGHGSDWVQDYSAAEGDVLVFGGSGNADQFQVNFTHTANRETGERSGDDDVQEAFVIYKPTGQILWALVDGGGEASINLQIGADTFDLLG
ncbi:MAG: TRAP transporter substrate-binding protein DctP [Jhaorihella sp.]